MQTYAKYSIVLPVIALILIGATQSRAAAQTPPRPPVFLAMPQTFPDLDARAVLMLEPGRDIIVLNAADAGPETLDAALGVLERMHRDHPRPADRGQLVPITGFVHRGALDPAKRAGLAKALVELGEQPLANVGNLGLGRWMQLR